MIRDLYELFEKKTGIILSKIPVEYFSAENQNKSIKLATLQLPIVGVVPCSCDILAAGGKCLFASEKPDHPFTKTLQEIATNLAVMLRYSERTTPKPMKPEKGPSDYSIYESPSEAANA
jgi:hypothetical protein